MRRNDAIKVFLDNYLRRLGLDSGSKNAVDRRQNKFVCHGRCETLQKVPVNFVKSTNSNATQRQ